MHANVIIGGTELTRAQFVGARAAGLTELVHLQAAGPSLTLKQIHALIANLTTRARLPRIVWIEEAGLLTLPAQNALLKSLEEPPQDTVFYLTLSHATLIPTILSRSTVINLATVTVSAPPTCLPLIKRAMQAGAGDRLSLTADLPSDRTQARAWLKLLLQEIAAVLATTTIPASLRIMGKLAQAASLADSRLKDNCNTTLTLQNFLLHLPKIRAVSST